MKGITLGFCYCVAAARQCSPSDLLASPVVGKPPCGVAVLSRRQAVMASVEEEEMLTAMLERHTGVHRLRLDYNRIGRSGAVRVGDVVAGSSARGGVLVLDLSHNHLGEDGAGALGEALGGGAGGGAALEELFLAHNNIGDGGVAALVAALGAGPSAHTLRRLDLSYNRIGDVGAMALAAALANPIVAAGSGVQWLLPGLEMLGLGNNEVGRVGGSSVASAVMRRGCSAGKAAAGAASGARPVTLRSVTLDYNSLGDAGASAFVPLLSAGGFGLRTLGLGGNEISDTQAVQLARALGQGAPTAHGLCGGLSHSLVHLMLAHNPIGDVGAAALADAAEATNSTLGMVVMVACRLTNAALSTRLRDALRSRGRDAERRSDALAEELQASLGTRRLRAVQLWAQRAAERDSGAAMPAATCADESESESHGRPQVQQVVDMHSGGRSSGRDAVV